MRCEISFFTENKEADLPSSLSTTVGWMPPEPETLTKSMEPPATDRKGRTPSRTSSTASSVMSGACVETRFYGAFVLNRCGDLHAIDATPARWRGAAGSSPQSAPDALIDFYTVADVGEHLDDLGDLGNGLLEPPLQSHLHGHRRRRAVAAGALQLQPDNRALYA